jgi:hypothetical protein
MRMQTRPWQGASKDSGCGGKVGGADRDRTDDPLLAKQMLSQLSYSPGDVSVD